MDVHLVIFFFYNLFKICVILNWNWLVISFIQFSHCKLQNFYTVLKASNPVFTSLIRGNLAYDMAKGRGHFFVPFASQIFFGLLFLLWFFGGRSVLLSQVQHFYPCQSPSMDLSPTTLLSFPLPVFCLPFHKLFHLSL